jgi:hypothetical protein
MGLFLAQALTVLLGMTLVIISLALLALVAAKARRNQSRAVKLVLLPARWEMAHTDHSDGSGILLGRAAPSRAPPVSDQRPSMDPLAELPPDDPVRA